MIMLNGTIGLCLLLGGLRHHEQSYNLPGARAFLSVVIPLAVFALILPNFTVMASGPILSTPQAINIAVLTLALYGVFLTMQTVRHRSFFQDPSRPTAARCRRSAAAALRHDPISFHTACLVLTLVPAVYLTEELGHIVEHAVKAMSAPAGLAGVIVAVLVLAPGGDGRVAGRLAKPAAARRQHRARLGARDDRLDHPGGACSRRAERHTHHPGPGSGADGAARRHTRRLDADLRRRPHQHAAGRGAHRHVPGVRAAAVPSDKKRGPLARPSWHIASLGKLSAPRRRLRFRSGRTRRCRRARNNPSGSSPDTAGDSPRRNRTAARRGSRS